MEINYINTIILTINHIGSIYAYNYISNYKDILSLLFLYQLNAIGITAGLHRLWSHKSYQARLPTKILLMILSSAANQGSIFHWVRDHRVHHKFSDTEADPHNINRVSFIHMWDGYY